MTDSKDVARALLGSWPAQVSMWGQEGIAAYLAELGARGVSPDAALVAIRSCGADQKFPPSAPELAALARRDPGQPTFEEFYRLCYGRHGFLKAAMPYSGPVLEPEKRRDEAARLRLGEMHPLIGSFVERFGLGRLRMLEVDDPVWGDVKRKDLREAWDRHVEAMEGREVAAIASGRRDGLRGLDPLSVLGGKRERPQIGAGS